MKTTSYDFFGEFSLEIRGSGGRSVDQIREMYDHFEVPTVSDPDVVLEVTRTEPNPDVVFGAPDNYYGREGDQFVIRNGANFVKLDVRTNHIQASPNMEPFYIVYIIEFGIRKRLAAQGRALIHASGVTLDGHTTLFPAWRGAGKTNTLLSLLEAGGDFLADDRLWVGSDGSIQGYPLSVNLQPYNLKSFPDLTLAAESDPTLQHRIGEYIEENCSIRGSILEKGLLFLSKNYLRDAGRNFVGVERMVPTAHYVDTDDADSVVFLRAAPNRDSVGVEPISARQAVEESVTISWYEWNGRLMEYFRALDSLFLEQNWAGELEELMADERRIFETLYENTRTYQALIPRERDWKRTGISRQIVELARGMDPKTDGRAVETVTQKPDSGRSVVMDGSADGASRPT